MRVSLSLTDESEETAYNPEDPFLNKTSPIPVWQGSAPRAAPLMRGGRGAGPGLLSPPGPMLPLPSMPHGHIPQRMGALSLPAACYSASVQLHSSNLVRSMAQAFFRCHQFPCHQLIKRPTTAAMA
jgi:hypothetical protein